MMRWNPINSYVMHWAMTIILLKLKVRMVKEILFS